MYEYDVIIIGAGASGLFCASQFDQQIKCLVLEQSNAIGKKLLLSGQGQCNFTNAIDIKKFIHHYGDNGKRIRSILYKYHNKKIINYFIENGLDIVIRDDLKVFPKSLKAQDVLHTILTTSKNQQVEIKKEEVIQNIDHLDGYYQVTTNSKKFKSKYLVIATGGCSYPITGSDDSIVPLLKKLNIAWVNRKQALVPIYIKNHSYKTLSGISIKNIQMTLNGKSDYPKADLLITHFGFSGPVILNNSRDIEKGDQVCFNYVSKNKEEIRQDLKSQIHTTKKTILQFFQQYFNDLPKRLIEVMIKDLKIDPVKKVANLSNKELDMIINRITNDSFVVEKLAGFTMAMVSKGGVSLDDVNLKNLESKKHPNLYFIGEVLDVDGDTGGFNIQFAFSSGWLVSDDIKAKQAADA